MINIDDTSSNVNLDQVHVCKTLFTFFASASWNYPSLDIRSISPSPPISFNLLFVLILCPYKNVLLYLKEHVMPWELWTLLFTNNNGLLILYLKHFLISFVSTLLMNIFRTWLVKNQNLLVHLTIITCYVHSPAHSGRHSRNFSDIRLYFTDGKEHKTNSTICEKTEQRWQLLLCHQLILQISVAMS